MRMEVEAATTTAAVVQHVTKSSSDQLLRKFADSGSSKKELRVAVKGRTRSRDHHPHPIDSNSDSPSANRSLVERKTLLPSANSRRRSSSALLRQLGIGKSRHHPRSAGRDFRNKSLFGSIEKTWRKTVQGASKVLLERHYNRHKRLISDAAAI